MRARTSCYAVGLACAWLFSLHTPAPAAAGQAQTGPAYLDRGKPVDERVRDLLARMTLEEKIGQMNISWGGGGHGAAMRAAAGGEPARTGVTTPVSMVLGWQTDVQDGARRQAGMDNELKAHAVKSNRLGIPFLHIEEGVHGLFIPGATIFPQPIGLGAAFNPELIRRVAGAMGEEARALGVNMVSTSPVLDVLRDPRMGRIEQSFGEDPFLVARIGVDWVRALQRQGVGAMPSHFAGQGEARRGIEHGPAEVSERTFREICLYPFEAAVREAGALAVMAGYNEVGGVPCHANEDLLTSILRGEWGFHGFVLSDSRGVEMLHDRHLIAPTLKDAGRMAALAGVDVNFPNSKAFGSLLLESVREGKVPEAVIDRAVGRILKVKMLLGLFEAQPVDSANAARIVDSPAHRELARQAARESIVLLKNEGGRLPLRKDLRSILVTGPNANAARNLLGGYTAYPGPTKVVTPLEGIRAKAAAGTNVVYVEGCPVRGGSPAAIAEAAAAARKADVAIVVAGDDTATVGEAHDRADLNLPGMQLDLVKAVQATGTPTILVLTTGRPASIAWEAEYVPAILAAWLPGEEGGNAIADVLFGDYNPGGRLPFTFPRSAGQLPLTVSDKPLPIRKYVDMDPTPLFAFGHGLSYTSFRYTNLTVHGGVAVRPDAVLQVSVDVENTGARAGDEAVLLFVRHLYPSVTRPIRMLKGFQRMTFARGEKRRAEFSVPASDLALWDRRMRRVVEPGDYRVMVGGLEAAFRVPGE
jgi:beta-glucosidase